VQLGGWNAPNILDSYGIFSCVKADTQNTAMNPHMLFIVAKPDMRIKFLQRQTK